jgi:cytochrome c-type biogenesis protein CcmH
MSAVRPIVRAALALACWLALCAAAANDPADRLANPAQEARARTLFRDVRCLVCQSESIDESDAALARDLRQLIRAQVAAGRSDSEIKSFLTSRYGEFVLMSPQPSLGNAVLWVGPLLVVAGGLVVLVLRRRAKPTDGETLSVEEEAALEKLKRGEHV